MPRVHRSLERVVSVADPSVTDNLRGRHHIVKAVISELKHCIFEGLNRSRIVAVLEERDGGH